MRDRERIIQTRLPELARFSETRGIVPGESLDVALAATAHPIRLFTTVENIPIAQTYGALLGKGSGELEISPVASPIEAALQVETGGIIPLVLHSATDPVLNERMFADGPKLGQLLMGHLYMPTPDHESPSLYAIGVSNQGLELIGGSTLRSDESLAQQIQLRRREILGENLTNGDFRDILQSPSVRKIIAHALGPKGTNISQAMKQYIEALGLEDKTDLIVHSGVEPMPHTDPAGINWIGYAEMARNEVEAGVIPIHMECAVYYEMGKLFNERTDEVVFADHHYMPLDAMQLASLKELEELSASGIMRIATHPSPRPLIDSWVKSGNAQWLKATSNSEAAQMVLRNEADACVTTQSGLEAAKGLTSRHIFGSPIMLFTIGTPLNQQQLRIYR